MLNKILKILRICFRKKEFRDTEYGDLTGQEYYGDIDVSHKNLVSLKGAPKKVYGHFNCSYNKLENLNYSPEIVIGSFNCSYNKIKSLKNGPKIVRGSLYINNNNLKNLEYYPDGVDGFLALNNNNIESLRGIKNIDETLMITSKFNKSKYLKEEFDIREKYPNYNEEQILIELYKITGDKSLVTDELLDKYLEFLI